MHECKEEPYDAAEDGFVFSNHEIDSFRTLRNRNDRALDAWSYFRYGNEDED
jgi:hypothetical protein